jgi:hypothetical protein
MVDLRGEVDRFAGMLKAADKRHATIAAYVTQAERFLNWLEGTYKPRTKRVGQPYGYQVSDDTVSRYGPLRDYLVANAGNVVSLGFRDIERIIGCRLPPSARRYAHWWANDRTGNHVQAHAWLSADRKVVHLDLIDERVKFISVERNLRPSATEAFD